MVAPYFNPHLAGFRPCWHCTSFAGMLYSGTAARCAKADATPVQAQPATGCAFWVREVGADDEPGPPAVLPVERAAAMILRTRHPARHP